MFVIVLMGILGAILLPTLQSVRESARRSQCANNIKQASVALLTIASTSGTFPSGTTLLNVTPTTANNTWCRDGDTDGYTPWTVTALPFLEKQDLYDNLTIGPVPEGRFMDSNFLVPLPNGATQNLLPLSVLQCPSSQLTSKLRNNYFGVQGGTRAAIPAAGSIPGQPAITVSCTNTPGGLQQFFVNGVLYVNSKIGFGNIRDGTSHVLLLGETRWASHREGTVEKFNWMLSGKSAADAIPVQVAGMEQRLNAVVPATGSRLLNWATRGFGSDHYGGAYFSLCDGSIHYFQDSVDVALIQDLAIRNNGGVVQAVFDQQ